ncbi:lipopolysaccharide biosynthesis protein [Glaciecola sp. KUL10]|uniref:lipopolysaccharide biosynthesis protein n=1 Tax=Glaciecola sp. (strain KUL10) TaxID=2161813 RepID=UPI000D7871D2|nr:lipopolysaccharide biosynthesis protein [Glaciecola sp. KUL10]GBL04187.1 capsular polysaccharide transport system permease protein [Glaciecola sp. KUL10]
MTVLQDDPAIYIKSLSKENRDNLDFLLEQIDVYWQTHPKIINHLFSRCKKLASDRGDTKTVSKIDALRLRWEVESEDGTEIEAILGRKSQKITPVNAGNQHQNNSLTAKGPIKAVRAFAANYGLLVFVIIPVLVFALYLLMIATPRFESQAQLVIKQADGAMSTIDPSLALLSGFGNTQNNSDTELVKAYILSSDMIAFLEQEIEYTEHFQVHSWDPFSRQTSDASKEDRFDYFQKHVVVEIDPNSSIISVRAQAFEPDFANLITNTIVKQAEAFINQIGHDLAKAQLSFVQNEHELTQEKLQNAQRRLLAFQRKYNLLDPEAEGVALQQITFELESRIATKTAELNALLSSMSTSAPLVIQTKDELSSLEQQLRSERERLTRSVAFESNVDLSNSEHQSGEGELGVNAILSKFSDYKIDLEFALQSYSASKLSLEQARIQAYKQLKYLVTIESPTYPEEAKYPKVFYNLVLLLAVLLAVYFIGKMLIATAEELK